jgi:hypothetical protein
MTAPALPVSAPQSVGLFLRWYGGRGDYTGAALPQGYQATTDDDRRFIRTWHPAKSIKFEQNIGSVCLIGIIELLSDINSGRWGADKYVIAYFLILT